MVNQAPPDYKTLCKRIFTLKLISSLVSCDKIYIYIYIYIGMEDSLPKTSGNLFPNKIT